MNRAFWNIWSSYATYYFGKVNLSIVIPVLLATYGDLSLYKVGFVASGFMGAYALGQFLHGQISERYNPFVYMSIGLIGSAFINMLLGFSAGFFWVLLIGEIIDGGFQSMGWSSSVRSAAAVSENVDRSSTILGTAYQAGNSVAWVVCAFVIGQFGWQWGFWVATIVMAIRGITLYLSRREIQVEQRHLVNQVKMTMTLPIVLSGVSLCLLNMVRYGVIIWIPTFLFRTQGMPIEKVGLNIFLIPLAGIVGTLLYNCIKLPKDITTIFYLTILGVLFFIFPQTSGLTMIVILLLSGFFLYGPHVFLVTTVPSRQLGKKLVAASTGFIDGMGYIGAMAIGMLVPFLIDVTGGWVAVFQFWAVTALVIVCLVIFVYFKTPQWREARWLK